MNSLILISPEKRSGFQPILSGNCEIAGFLATLRGFGF